MREIDSLQSNTLELKKLCLHVQTKGYSLEVDRKMMEQIITYGMESAFNIDHLHDSIKELRVSKWNNIVAIFVMLALMLTACGSEYHGQLCLHHGYTALSLGYTMGDYEDDYAKTEN